LTQIKRTAGNHCAKGEPPAEAAIAATGYDAPYGVEVIRAENRSRSVDELAEIAYRTGMAQFA